MKNISTGFIFVFLLLSVPVQAHADHIVYSQLTGNFWQIWKMDLQTKQARQLTDSPVDKRDPRCSPDGTQLLCRTANAELFLLNLKDPDQPARQVLADLGTIMDEKWSRDGKYILFTRMRSDLMDDSDVWLVDADGKNLREITQDALLQYHPVFLNDQEIIYVSQDVKTAGHNLWRKNIADHERGIQLTQGHFYDLLPDVSMGGQGIVFSSNRSGSFDIWSFDPAQNSLRQLTKDQGLETSPVFSLDGQEILFISTASGSKQIWLMKADGSGQVQITDNTAPRQEPSFCRADTKEKN